MGATGSEDNIDDLLHIVESKSNDLASVAANSIVFIGSNESIEELLNLKRIKKEPELKSQIEEIVSVYQSQGNSFYRARCKKSGK